jgi:hypothetical protein
VLETPHTALTQTDELGIGKAPAILDRVILACYFARVTRFLLAFAGQVTKPSSYLNSEEPDNEDHQ